MPSRVRLLICHEPCQSVQELPWCGEDPQCRHPSCTEPLEYRLAEHPGHLGSLADIEESVWRDLPARSSVLKELANITASPGQASGLGQKFYDVKSTFQEDAMKCWRQHSRTKNCGDYMSDRMRLLPDTKADRKEAGLDPKMRPAVHLCNYCPMFSIKMQRMRKDKYKYNYSE